MNYFLSFLSAAGISFVLTYAATKIGFKYGLVSKPRARDIHKKPVPRIGGLAIFGSFLIVTLFCFLILKDKDFGFVKILGMDRHLLGILAGGTAIAVTMLFDDIFGLRPWQKLSLQIFVALVVITSGIGINTLSNPFGEAINLNSIYIPIITLHGVTYHFSLLSDLLTLVWIVGMMNVVNFIDGVDGLAGGISAIAAFAIYLLAVRVGSLQSATALISIILSGAAVGFLLWNFPPAKIFMGDTGSMFLGFMLGVLPIISGGKLATAFLVLGFPIIDGLYVAVARAIRGENPLNTPDKTHLHHRFLRAGFTARQSIITLYLISAAFAWVALRSTTLNKIIASIFLIILLFVIIRILNIAGKRTKNKAISKAAN
jgi:UDP-GlcNAc:undecaprenyl-phosphate GlcNAc-1-phosphate transferase